MESEGSSDPASPGAGGAARVRAAAQPRSAASSAAAAAAEEGAAKFLVGLPSRGNFSSTIPSSNLNQMLDAKEDAIGGTCKCEETEILVGSERASHEIEMNRPFRVVDNSYLPPFSDDIALLILARLPSSKYCDLRLVNRRFRSLIGGSGELHEIRKKIELKVPKVFLFSEQGCYQCYEPYTRSCWDLPACPYYGSVPYCVRILFCVGTHLLVLGSLVVYADIWSDSNIWRYELESSRWFKGPMMITPRSSSASAACGSVACVAGGIQPVSEEVLNSAEKYNPESKSWEPLPSMNRRRMFCSGFYMDSKFYVIGGRNENRDLLTCAECYDFERNVWELIPNMVEDDPWTSKYSRPLYQVAVVNNELYHFEVPSRHLKVYMKNSNTWKKVGRLPASIELVQGCGGTTLKSVGDELLLISEARRNLSGVETILCFCTPRPELDDVEWHVLDFNCQVRYPAFYNCCVMMA